MIKANQCAADVQVRIIDGYKPKSLSEKYLIEEDMLFLQDGHVYNDQSGSYVFVNGCSGFNSGTIYLRDLLLVNIPKKNVGHIPLRFYPEDGIKWREPILNLEEQIDINDFDFTNEQTNAYFGDLTRVSNVRVDMYRMGYDDVEKLKQQFEYIYITG